MNSLEAEPKFSSSETKSDLYKYDDNAQIHARTCKVALRPLRRNVEHITYSRHMMGPRSTSVQDALRATVPRALGAYCSAETRRQSTEGQTAEYSGAAHELRTCHSPAEGRRQSTEGRAANLHLQRQRCAKAAGAVTRRVRREAALGFSQRKMPDDWLKLDTVPERAPAPCVTPGCCRCEGIPRLSPPLSIPPRPRA